MADKPKKDDEKTPATDENGELLHPDGMNPHVHPDGMNPHSEPEKEKEDEKD